MEKILVDTDVFIDFLRGYDARGKGAFLLIEQKRLVGTISVVTIAELYTGNDVLEKKKLRILTHVLSFFSPLPITTDIAKYAGSLRREYRMGCADSFIAATAAIHDLFLFTFNTKHFHQIKGLRFFSL